MEDHQVEQSLRERIRAEYGEMPGLMLTVTQASRLWNTDPATSRQVLDALVDSAFLRRNGACYVRADSGRESG